MTEQQDEERVDGRELPAPEELEPGSDDRLDETARFLIRAALEGDAH